METRAHVNSGDQGRVCGMGNEELRAEIERVEAEIAEHRQEIEEKTAWVAVCRQSLPTEHDGCFFLDGMTREELEARMATARGEMDEALAVIQGCEARLAGMA